MQRSSTETPWMRGFILALCLAPAGLALMLQADLRADQSGPSCDSSGEVWCCRCNPWNPGTRCQWVLGPGRVSCTSEFCSPNLCPPQ